MDTVADPAIAVSSPLPPDWPPGGAGDAVEHRLRAWANRVTFPRVLVALLVAAFAAGGTFARAFVTRTDLEQAVMPLRAQREDLDALRADVRALEALARAEALERRDMRQQLYELAVHSGARIVIVPERQAPHLPDAGADAGVDVPPRR